MQSMRFLPSCGVNNREKDLDDVRVLFRSQDRSAVVQRLQETCRSFVAEPALRANAERNWYVLFGQPLPMGGEIA